MSDKARGGIIRQDGPLHIWMPDNSYVIPAATVRRLRLERVLHDLNDVARDLGIDLDES